MKNPDLAPPKKCDRRIFPRFPFNGLTFKDKNGQVFSVEDIGPQGMRLSLKSGKHDYSPGAKLSGNLRWRRQTLELQGVTKWAEHNLIGVNFGQSATIKKDIGRFFGAKNLVAGIRPLHLPKFGVELPSGLKYWLQADAPLELFIWYHSGGSIARFYLLALNTFVEYVNGKGLATGIVAERHEHQTPLSEENECLLESDEKLDAEKLNLARNIVAELGPTHLPEDVLHFLGLKLKG